MTSPNLENLTVSQLRALQKDAEKQIKAKEAEERKAIIQKMRQVAIDAGYDPDELMGKSKKATRKLPPKYKDPKTGKTWSGKGPTPGWAKPYKVKNKMAEIAV
jgi:DNA-binding protein H-NS